MLCIGELLVDRITLGSTVHSFFGGAPANVAVNYAQLGGEAAVIAKVGADSRGRFLLDELKAYGVSTAGVVVDAGRHTSEVYVGSAESACRPVRDADFHLRPDEIDVDLVGECRILHTSVFSLSREPVRFAVLDAVKLAKEQGKLVSLELNYRPEVWPDRQEALHIVEGLLPSVDAVKPSLEDARSLYGELPPEEYLHRFAGLGPPLVVLTMGDRGCLLWHEARVTQVPGYAAKAVDTIGAGDAFWAGFLLKWLGGRTPVEAARFGNAVAALKVATVGAIAPLPPADMVDAELQRRLGEKEGVLDGADADQ